MVRAIRQALRAGPRLGAAFRPTLGVKTGANDIFLRDAARADELPRSCRVPAVQGRDVAPFAVRPGAWLLAAAGQRRHAAAAGPARRGGVSRPVRGAAGPPRRRARRERLGPVPHGDAAQSVPGDLARHRAAPRGRRAVPRRARRPGPGQHLLRRGRRRTSTRRTGWPRGSTAPRSATSPRRSPNAPAAARSVSAPAWSVRFRCRPAAPPPTSAASPRSPKPRRTRRGMGSR